MTSDQQSAKRLRTIIDTSTARISKLKKEKQILDEIEPRYLRLKASIEADLPTLGLHEDAIAEAQRELDILKQTYGECNVCYKGYIEKPYITPQCLHKICIDCYTRVTSKSCPECRTPFTYRLIPIVPDLNIRQLPFEFPPRIDPHQPIYDDVKAELVMPRHAFELRELERIGDVDGLDEDDIAQINAEYDPPLNLSTLGFGTHVGICDDPVCRERMGSMVDTTITKTAFDIEDTRRMLFRIDARHRATINLRHLFVSQHPIDASDAHIDRLILSGASNYDGWHFIEFLSHKMGQFSA